MDPTIQPTIVHLNQLAGPGHSDWNHFFIGSLNSGIDVPISNRNIDKRTGMNAQGPTVTTTQESNRSNNCEIFYFVRKTLYLAYRVSPWHGTIRGESKNLVRDLRGNKNSKIMIAKIIPELKKLGAKIL